MIKIIDNDKIPKNRRFCLSDDFEDIKAECYIDESKINISMPVKKNGEIWSPCRISYEKKYSVCKKVDFEKEIDHEFCNDIVCPFCGSKITDSWEMPDSSDEEICGTCGSEFSYERIVTIEYSTTKIKKAEISEVE